MHAKLAVDLDYVRRYTLRRDFAILWQTLVGILSADIVDAEFAKDTSEARVSVKFVSTPGGGCGTGAPRRFSSTHLPRLTGDVRLPADVVVRKLP